MKVCIRREAKKFEDKLFFIYGWKGDISQDAWFMSILNTM